MVVSLLGNKNAYFVLKNLLWPFVLKILFLCKEEYMAFLVLKSFGRL